MAKYSKKAEKDIGAKMHKMKSEDKPQKQKVAIAMSEAREKGDKVPEKKGDPKKKADPKSDKGAKGGREKDMMKKDDPMAHDTEHEDSREHSHLDYDSYKRNR